MLGKRIINTGTVACTTDTNQILDPGTTDSFALYRFEDNADDTSNSTGKFGKGAGLDGTTSIELPGQILGDLHNANTHSISVSTWIYWQGQTSENYAHLISAGYNQSGKSFWVGLGYAGTTSGVINEIYISGAGVSGGAIWSGVSMPINEWSHIVFTWTGTSAKLYLNGNLIATATMPTLDWRSSGNGFRLGRYYYNSNYYVKGFYDQTRIFNKAITQTEVNTLYAETTSTVDTVQILGDTSLKALYKFDGNLNDSSGNNYAPTANSNIYYAYNGTASSSVTYTTGKFDKAANFNGSNTEITVNSFASLTQVGISMWVNIADVTSSYGLINRYGTNREFGIYNYQSSNGFIAALYYNGNNSNSVQITASDYLTNNTWHHIAYSANGSTEPKLYIDGVQVGSAQYTDATRCAYYTSNEALKIGHNLGGYLNGKIDQVRIFNKPLSPGEVNSLYNETATSAALSTITNPSTVAYYKMTDATDETRSYNLTASNVDFNVEGKYGFAGKFNGTNSYLYAANSVQQPTTNFSASVWVYLNANSSGGYGIVGNFQSGVTPQKGWVIARSSADTKFSFWADGTANSNGGKVVGTTVIQTGVWYHVVGTYDGTNVKIYVNGSLENSATYSATPGTTNQPLVIGRWYGNYNDYYTDGKIDQVRIFNKAISAAEVTKLYNEIQCANTIATPESYFNTVTYSNPSTSQAYAVGFAPDFVWFKERTGTSSHQLYDTSRTDHEALFSNNTDGEYDYSNHPSGDLAPTITSTGFTTPSVVNAGINTSSDSYVSWNWKAGGILNQSAFFNGSNSYISTGYTAATGSAASISLWVSIASYTNYGGFAIDSTGSGAQARFTLGQGSGTSGNLWVSVGNGSTSWYDDTTISLTSYGLNKWFHLVGTVDGTSVKIYINGSLIHTFTSSISYVGGGQHNYYFGGWGSSLILNGHMDQVRFFNKSISDSEVTTLYNETSSTINTLQVLGDTSCVAAFPLGANANDLNTNNTSSSAANVTFNNPGHLHRNNNGTIGSTVSASPESGFSIVKVTFNTSSPQRIGHGLASAPEFIISKRTSTTSDWNCYHKFVDPTSPEDYLIKLNDTDGRSDNSIYWNDTAPTSSVFTTGSIYDQSETVIFYCFHSIDGYQRIGSYVGNNSTNGPFVYTGFEPAWLIVKRTDANGNSWAIFDNKRVESDGDQSVVFADTTSIESDYDVDFFANGFQIKSTTTNLNASGGNYIFMAIAANPDTTAPTKANSFETKIYTGNGSARSITDIGFKPDFVWIKKRANDTKAHRLFDSVRGPNNVLYSNLTNIAGTPTDELTAFIDGGFSLGNDTAVNDAASDTYVAWNWKALDHDRNLAAINNDGSITTQVSANPAAGFSIASYRGVGYPNATTATVGHGLSQAPDLVIIKGTGGTGQSSGAGSWVVGTGVLASDNWLGSLYLNSTGAYYTAVNYFWNGSATSSVVKLKNDWFVNGANNTYIMYSWHTVAGYSKVGVYSGTGISGKEVTLDFSPSFVLIKRTNAVTGWIIVDDQRGTNELYPHVTNIEDTTTTGIVLGTNKFTLNTTGSWYNASGGTYLYMAFS
tara:strand:- start:4306 stop:9003 length:4698 start_codon:yes stop_codon:yes gene_type:complete